MVPSTLGFSPRDVELNITGSTHHQNNKRKPLASSTVAAALKNLRTWGLIEVLGTDPETHVRIVNYEQYRGIPVGQQYSFERDSEQL